MIERKQFHIKHLDIAEVEISFKPLLEMEGVRFILGQLPQPNADARTLLYDGRVVCFMGYIVTHPGVAEVWLFPTVYFQQYAIVVREICKTIDELAGSFKWHRIQTVVQNNDKHRKWMKTLGFEEEGVLRKYFQKQDYIMSAKIFDWGE